MINFGLSEEQRQLKQLANDFSKNEINSALEKGFIPVSLGNYRLRTETAGMVACHTFHLKNALL